MSIYTKILYALRQANYESQRRSERRATPPKPENDRWLHARSPGVCDGCNADFDIHTSIVWNTLTKSTYHYNCNPNKLEKKEQDKMQASAKAVQAKIKELRNTQKHETYVDGVVTRAYDGNFCVGDHVESVDGRYGRIVRISRSTGYPIVRIAGRGYDVALSPIEKPKWSIEQVKAMSHKEYEKKPEAEPMVDTENLVSITKEAVKAKRYQIGSLPPGSTYRAANQQSESNVYMIVHPDESDTAVLAMNLSNGRIYKSEPTKTVVLVKTGITYSDVE